MAEGQAAGFADVGLLLDVVGVITSCFHNW